MKYLIAFLASLAILAATSVYAQEDPDARCVTVEKFVSQNEGTAKITWEKIVLPHQINLIRDALHIPENANVTEIRLFTATVIGQPAEAGIAFGHDGLVCVYATLLPSGVTLVQQILEATKGTQL